MPDPVGQAITVMLDRIEFLETRLGYLQKRLRDENRSGQSGDNAVVLQTVEANMIGIV